MRCLIWYSVSKQVVQERPISRDTRTCSCPGHKCLLSWKYLMMIKLLNREYTERWPEYFASRLESASRVDQFIEILTSIDVSCVPSLDLRYFDRDGLDYRPACIQEPAYSRPRCVLYEHSWYRIAGSFKASDISSLSIFWPVFPLDSHKKRLLRNCILALLSKAALHCFEPKSRKIWVTAYWYYWIEHCHKSEVLISRPNFRKT